ncbi:MAG: NAD(P)-binding protein, partial [Thermodesulfobacteriota bacterium]
MTATPIDTLIIGGGLSGIYAAWRLQQKSRPFMLLEARDRLGGRILSTEHQGFFTDL